MRLVLFGLFSASLLLACVGCGQSSNEQTTPDTSTSVPQETPDINSSDDTTNVSSTDQILVQTAEEFGLTPEMTDDIQVVRKIKPEEWDQINHDCMESFGFPELPNGGGWDISLPEQHQAYGLAMYSCLKMYPYDDIYTKPFGEAEFKRYYDYWGGVVLSCLKEHGYATHELPSFDVFKATAATPDEYYPVAEDFGSHRFDEASETCHVIPATDYILGLTDTP